MGWKKAGKVDVRGGGARLCLRAVCGAIRLGEEKGRGIGASSGQAHWRRRRVHTLHTLHTLCNFNQMLGVHTFRRLTTIIIIIIIITMLAAVIEGSVGVNAHRLTL